MSVVFFNLNVKFAGFDALKTGENTFFDDVITADSDVSFMDMAGFDAANPVNHNCTVSTDTRDGGKSLVYYRNNSEAYVGAATRTYLITAGSFADIRQITTGFGFKLSQAFAYDVPLFSYMDWYGLITVTYWLGTDGRLFLTGRDVDPLTAEPGATLTPLAYCAIADAIDPTAWNYLEFALDGMSTPGVTTTGIFNSATAKIYVNGNLILNFEHSMFTSGYVDNIDFAERACFIFPKGGFFGPSGTIISAYYDDMYLTVNNYDIVSAAMPAVILGPTRVRAILPDAMIGTPTFSVTGAASIYAALADRSTFDSYALDTTYAHPAGSYTGVNTKYFEASFEQLPAGLDMAFPFVSVVNTRKNSYGHASTTISSAGRLRHSIVSGASSYFYTNWTNSFANYTTILQLYDYHYLYADTVAAFNDNLRISVRDSNTTTHKALDVLSLHLEALTYPDTSTPISLTFHSGDGIDDVYEPPLDEYRDEDMIFTDVIFPACLGYGSTFGPSYTTTKIEVLSGAEQRNARHEYPRHRYRIDIQNYPAPDLMEIYKIFHIVSGSYSGFLFFDPADNTSKIGSEWLSEDAITNLDQTVATYASGTPSFELHKIYTLGNRSKRRRIKYPKVDTILVAIDGVATSAWTWDAVNLKLVLYSAPAVGAVITAGFEFYTPVRFANDELTFRPINGLGPTFVGTFENLELIELL
jgi:uncharacterized protein (TIGR02217 family)